MPKNKGIMYALIGAVSLVLLTSALTTSSVRSQAQGQAGKQTAKVLRSDARTAEQTNARPTAKELDDAATPVVDLNSAAADNETRQGKNRRHNNGGLEVAEAPVGNAEITVSSESSIPDFPFGMSDMVVEGTVTDSNAFISEDKTGVYSEYTITVSDVVKPSASNPVSKHDTITAERFGGRVRYPSGQIVRYKASGHGSPLKNAKYVFFLKKVDGGSYLILTAYELRGNKAFALDGSRVSLRKGDWAFDKHNGQDVTEFKKDLDKALKGGNNETPKVY
jgi:hypothetical protein